MSAWTQEDEYEEMEEPTQGNGFGMAAEAGVVRGMGAAGGGNAAGGGKAAGGGDVAGGGEVAEEGAASRENWTQEDDDLLRRLVAEQQERGPA